MKKRYIVAAILFLAMGYAAPTESQTWTWVSGSKSDTLVPDFGTRGQFSPSNQPPGLKNAAMWTGPDGRIYLFGGDNGSSHYYNTIWVYDPGLDEWMWKRGSNTPNASRVLGTMGYPSETNDPGARTGFAWSATSTGDLWIFGGMNQNADIYSDMWKYDFALDRWIWYSVSSGEYEDGSVLNRDANFPALGGVGFPGSRDYAQIYYDQDSSKAWLFMGEGFELGSPGTMADVWELDPFNHVSYFVAGTSNPDDGGQYPPLFNVEYNSGDASPPARSHHSLWKTSNGKFYFFGGVNGAGEYLTDLWSWNPSNEKWAFVAGADQDNYFGYYGTLGVPYVIPGAVPTYPAGNTPGSRQNSATWITQDGKLAIYGGSGYTQSAGPTQLNDLFVYDPAVGTMTWAAGSSTLPTNASQEPVFGVEGAASDSIYPGSRDGAAVTVDAKGKVWLFGGIAYSTAGNSGYRNDLFSYSIPAVGVFAGGNGTQGNPYLISSLTQLQSVGDYLDQHFLLTADIDASPTSTWNDSNAVYKGFLPIGTYRHPFKGTFDGNGHTISHLYINRGSTSAVGLFGSVSGSVTNVVLDSVNIQGASYVGGLTGRDVGLVENCSVNGAVTGSGNAVGGMAGDLYSGALEGSFASVVVVGGFVTGNGAGGLVGSVSSGSLVANCYATGSVWGDERVGGLAGNNDGTINLSYSTGEVEGNGTTGGLIGTNTGAVTHGYWNTESSGLSTSAAGTGETTLQMEQQATFTGFDFDSTWVLWEGLTFPALRNRLQTPPPATTGIASGVTKNDSVYDFAGTNILLSFNGIGTDSTLLMYVRFDSTAASNIGFDGTPPTYYSGYRWILANTGAGFTNASLVFTNIESLPGEPDPSAIKVYYRSTVGTGNFSLITSTSGTDSVAATVSAFGEYIFGSDVDNLNPLPLELAAFSANVTGRGVELRWKTVTELDNYGFDIERSQENATAQQSGRSWTQASFIKGAGTSNSPKEYSFTDQGLAAGKYLYRIKEVDQNGKFKYSGSIEADVAAAPTVFLLEQNYPNPFNPSTTIQFTLANDGMTTLKIYNVIGQEVAVLVNEELKAGEEHKAVFDGSHLASGMYVARLQSGNSVLLKKMMLVK
ncbi:MAG TPA: kelch repeat-containing protein [Bacteroidota bacterium]|nr:kelch repeat-containing protein [Bacteroidota bacterium]